MDINYFTEESSTKLQVQMDTVPSLLQGVEIALLTGCQDRHYAFGLAVALALKGCFVDIIGSDEIDSPEFQSIPNIHFLNFRQASNSNLNFTQKLLKLFIYYAKLIRYVARSRAKILHILWNYKLELFDRTILMLYFNILGKKVFLTAHNVNQARRDSQDSWLNRTTLAIQYRLCEHIFVHTQKMKDELCQAFGVAENAVSVIRYPINNAFAETDLTPVGAKRRLGLAADEKAILFLGRIVPYKGIESLLDAFRLLLADRQAKYRLIIAGEPKKGSEEYRNAIQQVVEKDFNQGQVSLRMQFIPDDEIELYLKGADVMVLPYKEIFQSGVLFLAYTFGLPVVATNVGSFQEEIVEGITGFLCEADDPAKLAGAIEKYFKSNLFRNLTIYRRELRDYAMANHSWHAVAELTCNAYVNMLGK